MGRAFSRILALVLALCVWTAFTPLAVLASEGDVCKIVETETGYSTLDEALAAFETGQTIQLLGNINYSGGIVITDKTVTFDLNGYNLNVVNPAEGDSPEATSGLCVIGQDGNAGLTLLGEGEFNVTGTLYGVYVQAYPEKTASATVTNATATAADTDDAWGCGAYAGGENATITVLEDATATGAGGNGATGNSLGSVTVKGNVIATAENVFEDEYGWYRAAVEAWDDGEVVVEGHVTATGDNSIGVLAAGSCVTVLGDVTGVVGGVFAYVSSGVEIGGKVTSTDESGFGVMAIDNCIVEVDGDVVSGGTGAMIMGDMDSGQSEISIDGEITAPVYIRIGETELGLNDYVLDPDMVPGYRIYTIDSNLGAVLVLDVTPPEFAGGDGTEANPYLVATADQLNNVRNHLDKHFRQTADIDLDVAPYNEGEGWVPIGTSAEPFTGTYDGDNNTISGLSVNRPSDSLVGLFGVVKGATLNNLTLADVDIQGKNETGGLAGNAAPLDGRPTEIQDVHVTTGSVSGHSFVGGLVGVLAGSDISGSSAGCDVTGVEQCLGGLVGTVIAPATIWKCHATGNVTVSEETGLGSSVGGLAGNVPESCTITESYASGKVKGKVQVGGLAGYNGGEVSLSFATGDVEGIGAAADVGAVGGLVGNNYGGQVSRCFAEGDVSSTNKGIGGLVGTNTTGGTIGNCYAMGAVEGLSMVGGLIGWKPSGSVAKCYATGQVTGTSSVGGLIGEGIGICTGSYWDTDTSGCDSSAGGEGVVGKTTADMKLQSTYVDWDFTESWDIDAGQNSGYPFLRGVTPVGPGTPDSGAVAADKAALTWDAIKGGNGGQEAVTVDLVNPLPTSGANGTTISWSASPVGFINTTTGAVTRPAFTDGDKTVTLTATISKGEASDTKAFTLTIIALPAPPPPPSGGTIPAYLITVNAGPGGTITPKTTTVLMGASVTFTVTPDEGYEIADVFVDGQSVGAVDRYTFDEVASSHNIAATFRKAFPFEDVAETDWFYSSVRYVFENGLMTGTAPDRFDPLLAANRAMVVTIFHRLEETPDAPASSFADVLDGAWYEEAVAWAAANGIAEGFGDGRFQPEAPVTREQLACFFYRYSQYAGRDVSARAPLTDFVDGDQTSEWAREAMEWAVGCGLIRGKDGGVLDPTGTATRAELAAILQRFIEGN